MSDHRCPICGQRLELGIVIDLRAAVSRSLSTVQVQEKSTYQDVQQRQEPAQPHLPALLVPIAGNAAGKASLWKRALAIAHRVIEEHPGDDATQTDAFKTYCIEQGLDYRLPGGAQDRPLYARALDYVRAQRRRRASGMY